MYAIVLAALGALVWGAADFCGGKATQRAQPLTVTVVSQILGLPMIALLLLALPGTPRGSDIAIGAAAGVFGLLGIVLLYRGLSGGAMAVVAPTTAVTSAVVPMLVGLVQGERPPLLGLVGAFCAVVAIGMVSLGPSKSGARVTIGVVAVALLAGACFGTFFAILGQAHEGAGMWPMFGVRLASIPVGLILMLRSSGSKRVTGSGLALALAAGIGDTLANGLYLLAVQAGQMTVVAPIAALYPTTTVLLALIVEKERIKVIQIAGLALAGAALVLTASPS